MFLLILAILSVYGFVGFLYAESINTSIDLVLLVSIFWPVVIIIRAIGRR